MAQDTEDANPGETTFVSRATDGKSRGDYTYLSDPSIDGPDLRRAGSGERRRRSLRP